MFNTISFNTLIPCGTISMTSGSPKFFGILIFGASACLGGMYGANKCLVSKSPSSRPTSNGVFGGAISFTFGYLLLVHFLDVVSEGPGRSIIDFMDVLIGWTRTFSIMEDPIAMVGHIPLYLP